MFLEWNPYWIITFFLDNHKKTWDLWHKFYLIDCRFDFAPIFIRKHVGILSAYTKLSSRLCKTIIPLFRTAYPLPVNYYPSNPKTIMSSIPRKWGCVVRSNSITNYPSVFQKAKVLLQLCNTFTFSKIYGTFNTSTYV